MTDKELIKKAEKALEEMGFNYNKEYEPSVNRAENELLIEAYPEFFENEYSIHFPSRLPDGRMGGLSITVDKKTDKLLLLITRSNTYEIPEELS